MLQVPKAQVQVQVQVLKTNYKVQPKYKELSSPAVGVYILHENLDTPNKKDTRYLFSWNKIYLAKPMLILEYRSCYFWLIHSKLWQTAVY